MSMPADPGPPWKQDGPQTGKGLGFSAAVQALQSIAKGVQQLYQMFVLRLPLGGQTMATGTANTTGTASTLLVPAVSGKRLWINAYSLVNSGASGTTVSLQDGNGGTTIWEDYVPAGSAVRFNTDDPMFATTAGNALYFQAGTGTTTLYVSAAGFAA